MDLKGLKVDQEQRAALQTLIDLRKKNVGASFFLAVFLGPIGIIYVAPVIGILALLLGVSFAVLVPFGAVAVWICSMAIAPAVAVAHNERVEREVIAEYRLKQTK